MTLGAGPSARLVPVNRFALELSEATVIDLASIQVPLDTVLQLIVWADVCVAAAFVIGVFAFGICCGAEDMRERKQRRASRPPVPEPPSIEKEFARVKRIRTVLGSGALSGAMVLALGLTACAPKFQHLDGTALHPIAPPQALDNGWVVIDSCASGIHALVERQIEAEVRYVQPPDLERIALRWSSSDRWRTGQVHVEGPFCTWSGPVRLQDPRMVQVDHQVNRLSYGGEQPCMYVVQVQFDLDRLPTPGDSVVVVHGQHLMQLAWR